MSFKKYITLAVLAGCSCLSAQELPEFLRIYTGLSGPVAKELYNPAENPEFRKYIRSSRILSGRISSLKTSLKKELPLLSDELYLEFYKTGNRTGYQDALNLWSDRLIRSAYAALIYEEPLYLREVEKTLREFIRLKSWVLPAHDVDHTTFDGKVMMNDLVSTENAKRMTAVICLLKDRLDPELYAKVRAEIFRRIIDPIERQFDGKQISHWWMRKASNWNAVCFSNLIYVGACMLEAEPTRRDRFLDCCIRGIQHSLEAFPEDGYCSEGASYWNYGMGHFIHGALAVYILTDGKENLLALPKAANPLKYPEKIMMTDTVIPAFADCRLNISIDRQLLQIIDFLQGRRTSLKTEMTGRDLCTDFLLFQAKQTGRGKVQTKPGFDRLSEFDQGGVMIVRPGDSKSRLHAAFKSGSNHELHNHNDVGSYVILSDGIPVLADIGCEVYTAKTFSLKRYESKALNSFGHPVPVIDGKLQIDGEDTDAGILQKKVSKDAFLWQIEMKKAYRIRALESLKRTFAYEWQGSGKVTIIDEIRNTKVLSFEEALISPGKFRRLSSLRKTPGKLYSQFVKFREHINFSSFRMKI